MFTATPGYSMVGSDFSQQEPRILSHYSGDENMIEAYKQGKDLYATIAAGIYHNDYWDNMEKHEDGSPNPEGKKRRSRCKSLLLGITYQMGSKTLAESIGCTKEEAQKIIDDFYHRFPKVRDWVENTLSFVREHGYVEDFYGRRRRLPDVHLDKYAVKYITGKEKIKFNPLLYCEDRRLDDDPLIKKYQTLAEQCKNAGDLNALKDKALKDDIEIHDNTGFISRAERQCVNARVQGGAATMSKIALRKVYDDPVLKDLGFRILLQIHDEFIGECPKENETLAAERLTEVMKNSVSDIINVPFKCDPDVSKCWYYNDYSDILNEDYNDFRKNHSAEESFAYIQEKYSECTPDQLHQFLNI